MKLKLYTFTISLIVLLPINNGQADTLGRLFTTPQERAALDSKSGIKFAARNLGENDPSQQIKLNGTVISSTGKRKIWVNGKNHENKNPDEPRAFIINSKQVRLDTPYGTQGKLMKPGQVLDLTDGKIHESFMLDKDQPEENNKNDALN